MDKESAERGKRLNKKRISKLQDYRSCFTSEYGKRVLYDMFNEHCMISSTFDPNPQVMALREGERNVVLRILTMLKTSPEKLKLQIEESDRYANQDII